MFQKYRYLPLIVILLMVGGCYPFVKKEVREPTNALKKVRFFWPQFQDDMDPDSLAIAIERSLDYIDRLKPRTTFTYGPDTFTVEHIRDSFQTFLHIANQNRDIDSFNSEIRRNFFVYKAAGARGDKKVLFTGYFEPILRGNPEPDSLYRYPIYERPEDLVQIDLGQFHPKFYGERIMARIDGRKVIPYHTRQDIAEGRVLAERELEIAWLADPLDIAILQIQGSGIIEFPTGERIRVGYSASNGHPYRSIGRYLIDKGDIHPDNLSLQTIKSFLDQHPEIKDDVLNYNPSYVFFRVLENGPLGSIGVPLTPRRSLALDTKLFPKGALAYIRCQTPIVGETGTISKWVPFSGFVLNQDTGGAIKGAGRADIFWGSGSYAELAAGHLKHKGELYFLVKKPSPGTPR